MTRIRAQRIGDQALLPQSDLLHLVNLARQIEQVELLMHVDDVPTLAMMKLAEDGGAFDFWKDEGEEIYSPGP